MKNTLSGTGRRGSPPWPDRAARPGPAWLNPAQSPAPGRGAAAPPLVFARRTAPPRPGWPRSLGRFPRKPSAARCSRASPTPVSRQWMGLGRRTETPFRKLIRAAGLPRTFCRTRPARSAIGVGQGKPRPARCCIRSMKNGSSSSRTPPLVDGEDEAALIGVEQEVGVLDPLRYALERQRRAAVVTCEKRVQLRVGDVGVDGHSA